LIATTFAALRRSTIAAPAKDRRPAQRREFLALLAALPSRSWRVFCDGSSFDSTRAGAGYVATGPRNDLLFATRYSLVPPATMLLSWLLSRTLQTTV
jgi:hypothetical protein